MHRYLYISKQKHPYSSKIGNSHLTRAPLGGGQNLPPPGFPEYLTTPKLLQILAQNLVYLILHQFAME